MNLGYSKSVAKKLQRFQREYITQRQMKEMVLDTYEPFTIQSFKKDGTRITREAYSVVGPKTSGNAPGAKYTYWRAPYNYMILYDIDKSNFRTFRLDFVNWIEKDGQRYFIRN